jgi:hypothetical protein
LDVGTFKLVDAWRWRSRASIVFAYHKIGPQVADTRKVKSGLGQICGTLAGRARCIGESCGEFRPGRSYICMFAFYLALCQHLKSRRIPVGASIPRHPLLQNAACCRSVRREDVLVVSSRFWIKTRCGVDRRRAATLRCPASSLPVCMGRMFVVIRDVRK